jgi:translation initiation factor 3 subunit D
MPSVDSEVNSLIAAFKTPMINDNTNGWGPIFEPDQFKDLPYQKFSKSDKIGKVCTFFAFEKKNLEIKSKTIQFNKKKIADWTGASHVDKKNYNRYQPQFSVGNVGQYSYFHEEDESQFTLVDTSKTVRTQYQKIIRQQFQNVNLFLFFVINFRSIVNRQLIIFS